MFIVYEVNYFDFLYLMWNSYFVNFNFKWNVFGLIEILNILGIVILLLGNFIINEFVIKKSFCY